MIERAAAKQRSKSPVAEHQYTQTLFGGFPPSAVFLTYISEVLYSVKVFPSVFMQCIVAAVVTDVIVRVLLIVWPSSACGD